MQTQTIVRASADLIRITRLRPDDVYRRLVKRTYGDGDRLVLGIVTSVDHNGSDAMITALEFGVNEIAPEPEVKLATFGGERDIALFPAAPEEIRAHFTELTKLAQRKVSEAHDKLTAALEVEAAVKRVRRRARTLTAPETTGEPLEIEAEVTEAEVTEEVPF